MKYKMYYCASQALSDRADDHSSPFFPPVVFFLATEFPFKYYILQSVSSDF